MTEYAIIVGSTVLVGYYWFHLFTGVIDRFYHQVVTIVSLPIP